MKNNKFHIFLLFLCSFLWGTTFVAQSIGAEHVGAFTYLAGRSWVAVAFLTPVVHVMDRFFDRRGIDNRRPRNASQRKYLITAGCISGVRLHHGAVCGHRAAAEHLSQPAPDQADLVLRAAGAGGDVSAVHDRREPAP